MKGKVCLVTGANSGLGKAVALALAGRGATVVMISRDRRRGESACREIIARTGNSSVDLLLADLSDRSSIRLLTEEFKRRYGRLHVLVNSASVLKDRRVLTPDGLEMMFATNHLGYFLLTTLLLDLLERSAPAFVFNITAPSSTRLDFEDLQGEQSFNALRAFGASKMCNLLFSFALARRVQDRGVSVAAYHPGVVSSTNLMREAPPPLRLLLRLARPFLASPERAVEGLAQLAADGSAKNGQFYHRLKSITANPYAYDEQAQERLWSESERLVSANR